jgi:phospholipid transport system substrate-binding protein
MSTRFDLAGATRRRFLQLMAGGAIAGVSLLLPAGSPRAAASAEAYVTDLSNSVLDIVKSGGSAQDKRQRFRSMVEKYADVPAISVFSLGQYAKALPDARKKEYYGLMQDYLARLFLNHIETFRGDKVEITGVKERSPTDVIVSTNMLYADGRKLAINWRLVQRGGAFKIFDASIEGVWLAVQQRSSFVSTIAQKNGDIEALMDFLKKSAAA